MKDYYHALGLSISADEREIKAAFKKLALQWHPDRNPGNVEAENRFKLINEAYQVLSDPAKKAQYDHIMWAMAISKLGEQSEGQQPPAEAMQKPKPVTSEEMYFDTRDKRWRTRRKLTPEQLHKIKQERELAESRDSRRGIFLAIGLLVGIFGIAYLFYFIAPMIEREPQRAQKYYEQIVQKINTGAITAKELDEAFQYIRTKSSTLPDKVDRDAYRAYVWKLQNYLPSVADDLKHAKNYQESLAVLELWASMSSSYEKYRIDTLKSICMTDLGRYKEAADLLKPYMNKPADERYITQKMAHAYTKGGFYEDALVCYEAISRKLMEDYISMHGKAYPMFLNFTGQPEADYIMYIEKASVLCALGRYKEATASAEWAGLMRPKKGLHLVVLGDIAQANGNSSKACTYWEKAYKLGAESPRLKDCR